MNHPDLEATQLHIELLRTKRDRLTAAIVDAEGQQLAAIRRAWDAGSLTWGQLLAHYDQLRASNSPQFSTRWNRVIGLHSASIREQVKYAPNMADGWHGRWPLGDGDPRPLKNRYVVYVLFDDARAPIYTGSTQHWTARMKKHQQDGKSWSSWIAHTCRDRDDAYRIESLFLDQYKPPLNVRGPEVRAGAR